MDAIRRNNGCEEVGVSWEKNCTLYPSKTGTPFVAFIHAGGHEIPPAAPAAIVKFFKEHPAQVK